MPKFKDLEIGQRFKYNLMIWRKIKPRMSGENLVNAEFVSDDHYEKRKTDVFVEGGSAYFGDLKDVEVVNEKTRREKELEETETSLT